MNAPGVPASAGKRRAWAPHCDPTILHAPGECSYCDDYGDWQEYRQLAGISFTGHAATDTASPCPSTWRRLPKDRDQWYRNSPIIREEFISAPA